MDVKDIEQALVDLNAELKAQSTKGEVCLYGGAVMCLVYQARPATRDVDAIFEPTQKIREAARRVAERRGLEAAWLNDAVKGFVVDHPRKVLYDLSNLKVYVPDPEYLLAMKCLAARVDATDREDVRFLLKRLGIREPERVFAIISAYYPHEQVKPATRFFVEELLGS